MNHSWVLKSKKWERYGVGYIYKEETCVCGCVRRIVIDEEGYEVLIRLESVLKKKLNNKLKINRTWTYRALLWTQA